MTCIEFYLTSIKIKVSLIIMNLKGGGLTFVNDSTSDEMRMFRGGLRHIPLFAEKLRYNQSKYVINHHDTLNYERGVITHSRSPST